MIFIFKKAVKLNYKRGLHLRPASILVQEAEKYDSYVKIIKANKEANLKSILGVLWLKIAHNEEVSISAEGKDEKKAVNNITQLIENGLEDIINETYDKDSSKKKDIEEDLKEEVSQEAEAYNSDPVELLKKVRAGVEKIKDKY